MAHRTLLIAFPWDLLVTFCHNIQPAKPLRILFSVFDTHLLKKCEMLDEKSFWDQDTVDMHVLGMMMALTKLKSTLEM